MLVAVMLLVIIVSIFIPVKVPVVADGSKKEMSSRWSQSFHRFTWGAGIEAMKPPKPPLD